ncbi:MAG: hypothetical protein HC853_12650 [Anaerolineae bacterium]|nr:hypothetical protein [Anaerolineae bacterium]
MAKQQNSNALQNSLVALLSIDELKLLCRDQGNDHAVSPVGERSHEDYAIHVIEIFRTRNALPELVANLKSLHPETNWEGLVTDTDPSIEESTLNPQQIVNTQGGSAISGELNISNGNFIGRDSNTTNITSITHNVTNYILPTTSNTQDHSATPYIASNHQITTEAILYTHGTILHTPARLFGRDDLLRATSQLLEKRLRILVKGMAGIGKTAFVATLANRYLATGQAQVLWIQVGVTQTDSVLEAIADCLGARQSVLDKHGQARLLVVRGLLAAIREAKPLVLVLDDVWEGKTLYELRPAIPLNVSVIVSSRQVFPDHEIVEIPELNPNDALHLLSAHAGQDLSQDRESLTLCNQLGWHPYSIEVAGATLRVDNTSCAELRSRIASTPHDLPMPEGFSAFGRDSLKDLLDDSLEKIDEISKMFLPPWVAFLYLTSHLKCSR